LEEAISQVSQLHLMVAKERLGRGKREKKQVKHDDMIPSDQLDFRRHEFRSTNSGDHDADTAPPPANKNRNKSGVLLPEAAFLFLCLLGIVFLIITSFWKVYGRKWLQFTWETVIKQQTKNACEAVAAFFSRLHSQGTTYALSLYLCFEDWAKNTAYGFVSKTTSFFLCMWNHMFATIIIPAEWKKVLLTENWSGFRWQTIPEWLVAQLGLLIDSKLCHGTLLILSIVLSLCAIAKSNKKTNAEKRFEEFLRAYGQRQRRR
jgi:hypothetical protein